jgi:hypothetical protein
VGRSWAGCSPTRLHATDVPGHARTPRYGTTSGLRLDRIWYVNTKAIREYLSRIGKRGGAAGKGSSKVRGDTEYYKRISQKAAKARKAKRKGSKRQPI